MGSSSKSEAGKNEQKLKSESTKKEDAKQEDKSDANKNEQEPKSESMKKEDAKQEEKDKSDAEKNEQEPNSESMNQDEKDDQDCGDTQKRDGTNIGEEARRSKHEGRIGSGEGVDHEIIFESINASSATANRLALLESDAHVQFVQETRLTKALQVTFDKDAKEYHKNAIGSPLDPEHSNAISRSRSHRSERPQLLPAPQPH